MTSYAPNFTGRYRAHYHVCGIDHTIQLRRAIGASPASVALLAATATAIFTPWVGFLGDDFAWISAEQADEGSDIFYPSTTPAAVIGTVPVSTYTPFQKVTHTRFGGRAAGSRSSIEMYGIQWFYADQAGDFETIGYDGVVTAAERPAVGTTAAALNTQAFANSGGPTTWAARATIKVNDFWLKQVRSGGIT